MNKILAFTLVCALFSASGMAAQDKPVIDPAKTLIAYYSWSGNTKEVALQIQRLTGGTLFEIVPETAYPSNYNDCVNQAREETRKKFQPPLKNSVVHMEQYEVIFVGSPNWWGTIAPPVATFLATHDLDGKTLIPFFTHGSGGMQNCERDARELAAKAKVLKAEAFLGSSVKSASRQIEDFVRDRVVIGK